MAVPKRRRSKARGKRTRAAWIRTSLRVPKLVKCSNPACKQLIVSHRVCPYCGWYKGRQVLEIKEKGAVDM